MVAVRAAETQALDVLSKAETTDIFQKALQASLERTGQSLMTAATHPVDTIKGVPAGIGRFFERVSRDVTTGMQKVGDAVQQRQAQKAAGQRDSDLSEAVLEGAATVGQSVFGYDDLRRRLAKYCVDPYTTNSILARKLDKAAWVVWGGEFGPEDTYGIRSGRLCRQVHAGLGERPGVGHDARRPAHPDGAATEGFRNREEPIDRFLRQKWFTDTIRLGLVDSLAPLGAGPGRSDVIDWALTADLETQARFMAGSVAILARQHLTAAPITGMRVAALGLQRALGLGSYETSWTWLHKLRRAMVRPGRDHLAGEIEADETYVGGPEEGKRGRAVESKAIVAVAAEQRGRGIGRIRLRRVKDVSAESLLAFLQEAVEPGENSHRRLERLCRAAGRRLSPPGHGDQRRLGTGARGHAARPQSRRPAQTVVVGDFQGGIQHQHLDDYLDEFTFRFNRRRSQARGLLFHRLVQQAVAIGPAPYHSIITPRISANLPELGE